MFACSLGLIGFVFIGPVQLFVPAQALLVWKSAVWLLMLILYLLLVSTSMFLRRPQSVIYNISREQIRTVISDAAMELGQECVWAGGSVNFPDVGINLILNESPRLRTVSLLVAGYPGNLSELNRLERALAKCAARLETAENPIWKYQAILAVTLLVMVTGIVFFYHSEILAAFTFYATT